jgi:hypothetical protein
MRQRAASYGYLRSNPQVSVSSGQYIEILPVNPAFIVVPYYNPAVVFVAPRRGVVVGPAIHYGFGVSIGTAFAPWGWGSTRFAWGNHALFINNAPWRRTWTNRAVYVHPYGVPRRVVAARAAEQHRVIARSAKEREAEHAGHPRPEEHRKDKPR